MKYKIESQTNKNKRRLVECFNNLTLEDKKGLKINQKNGKLNGLDAKNFLKQRQIILDDYDNENIKIEDVTERS